MVEVFIDPLKIEEAAWLSEGLSRAMEDAAQRINEAAAAVFLAEEKKTNEFETSQTTPPKYIESFKTTRRPQANGKYSWLAVNDDPGAAWVEFGAHAGGKTHVLKYRPYGRALDIIRLT